MAFISTASTPLRAPARRAVCPRFRMCEDPAKAPEEPAPPAAAEEAESAGRKYTPEAVERMKKIRALLWTNRKVANMSAFSYASP